MAIILGPGPFAQIVLAQARKGKGFPAKTSDQQAAGPRGAGGRPRGKAAGLREDQVGVTKLVTDEAQLHGRGIRALEELAAGRSLEHQQV
jgi:hypothetical protein